LPDHIVHHILTIYALGASPSLIQTAYNQNANYQRPVKLQERKTVDLSDRAKFKKYLSNPAYYHDYLVFFQKEIDSKGVEAVLNEHVFAGDEHADRMFVRMFAGEYKPLHIASSLIRTGFLHPIIHLGFGLEYAQNAIVAEGLAGAACHDDWVGQYLLAAEKAAGGVGKKGSKSLKELLDEIYADKKLSTAAHWEDGNKIRDGIIKRAPDEMIKIGSQWTVSADQLEEKTAEMINANSMFTNLFSKSVPLTPSSLLHRWSAESTQNRQVRLLLHALCQ